MNKRQRFGIAGLTIAALTLAACGSSKSISGSGDSGSSSPSASTATGEPIKLGLINQGKGALVFPEVSDPMIAAVKWVNDHGGINGRRIDLKVCQDDGTVGGSAACATELVSEKVVAVLNGEDLNNASAHPILESANIPVVGWNPFTAADFASKNAFWMSPGYDVFSSLIKIMATQYKYKNVGYLKPDLASSQGSYDIMKKAAAQVGLNINMVQYNYASASYAGPAAQLAAAKPDAIYTYASDKTATPIIQAIRASGYTGPIYAGTTRTFVDVLGADSSKDISVQATLYDWHIPEKAPEAVRGEIKEFLAAMKAGAPDTPITAYGQWAFSATMDALAVMKELDKTAITPDTFRVAMKKDATRHNYMGGTFNCATNPLPISPGTCVRGMQIVSFDGKSWQQTGKFVSAVELIS